ncbi:MAG TPA: RHS repeat-associated core domain-containing protein, partial [Actinoplanes sp.]|nr:RHS repeat-associated core domain-containing protein [Actinoplanes sp.]
SGVTGAQTSMSYPAAGGLVTEEVTTDYDNVTGLPARLNTSLTGAAGTIATASYTAYGERSGSLYKLPGGKWVQDIVDREEGTRRITRTRVQQETATGTISDRNYTYDQIGNILSIDDRPEVGSADKQCFRLDPLGRLSSAWTPKATTDCKVDPAVAELGGPAPYWQDWTFDVTGSRLTETSHAAAGDTLRRYGVPQGGKDVVRPHAVTGMSTTAPGQAATATQYRYDGGGNMICRPAAGSNTNNCDDGTNSQTLEWDAEGELATIKAGATTVESNVYDIDGGRLIRRDAGGTTLYLPGQEIRLQGSAKVGTRYYTFGGTIAGSRKGSSDNAAMTWLFTDHQGTQQIGVNGSTQAVTSRRQTPFGAARGTGTQWVNEMGFVGGDNDPSGLVSVGARRYDTALGRFISVDPVMDMADPQQWNAYSYAYNSPISHSDPTGMDPCPGGNGWGGGCYYDGTTTQYDGVTKEQMKKGTDERNRILADPVHKQRMEQQKQEAREREKQAQIRAQRVKECNASFWCRARTTAKAAAGVAGAWATSVVTTLKSPQALGIMAGIAVGLTCTLFTGGGGAILCGALGGAVTGFVTAKLQCHEGDSSKCGAGNQIRETAVGALLGAAGGVLGAGAGSAARGASNGLKGAAAGAWNGVRSLGGQTDEAVKGLISTKFITNSRAAWKEDVATMGGGVLGNVKVLGDTVALAGRGALTREGLTGGVLGGVMPGTQDEFVDTFTNGFSFDPVKTPIQMLNGAVGGGIS